MSHILLYLSSTIIVLKKDNYCRQQVDNICRRQYLSSTGWLKAGYGLVMMMMMTILRILFGTGLLGVSIPQYFAMGSKCRLVCYY